MCCRTRTGTFLHINVAWARPSHAGNQKKKRDRSVRYGSPVVLHPQYLSILMMFAIHNTIRLCSATGVGRFEQFQRRSTRCQLKTFYDVILCMLGRCGHHTVRTCSHRLPACLAPCIASTFTKPSRQGICHASDTGPTKPT